MSILEACASETCPDPQLLTASVSQQQNPILKRLTRLMDSTGEETDADSESLELALLDVELTKYAAHEGIHIPAASPCTSAGASSVQQQLSTTLVSPRRHAAVKPKPAQPGTVLQLVQQQSKFLDVLQTMIDKNVGLDKPTSQQHAKSNMSSAVQAASSSTHPTAAGGDMGPAPPAGPELSGQQLGVLQVQYERQIADNHALKKRCLKVQKAMLRHMQAARAQAAGAEAAAEEAQRREQQAAAVNTALQAQMSQQQQMLEAQQQQLSGMQEQLSQLKDLHKKKLSRYKVQLQQQYESQLAAATNAYTQELSLVHAVQLSAGERFTSAGGASSCSDSGPTPRQLSKKPRQSSATGIASNSSSQGVLAHTAGVAGPAGTPPTNSSSSGGKKAAGAQGAPRRSTSGGCRSSAGGSSKPAGAADPAAVAAPAASVGAAAGAGTARRAGAASDAGSQEALSDASAAAATVGASLSTTDLCAGGSLRQLPSLPLYAVDSSSQLLQQMSISTLLQDPHSSSTQQTGHLQQAQAQKHKKQYGQRQQAGGSGAHRAPDTPRRATVNGSGPRQHSAAGESRAARSKTMPAAMGDATAAAQARESAAASSAEGVTPAPAAAMPTAVPPVAEGSSGPAAELPAAVDGSVAVAVAQQLQSHLLLLLAQQLAEHLPPELADIDPNAILSLQQAVADHVEQQEQQQGRADEAWVDGAIQDERQQQGQWQQQQGASEGQHVPEEVLHYAQQYQQGGEGGCRPPTATPSVLQHQRQQQVPEVAAQLAQHFVTGGEGTSRPLTAPSSDRSRASQQQQQAQQTHQPRASSPSGGLGAKPVQQQAPTFDTHLELAVFLA